MPSAALSSAQTAGSPGRIAPALWALLALFVLRVIGQGMVVFAHVPWLPPEREWYSGVLAYPLLLPCQLLIILLLGAVSRDFSRGRGWFVTPRPWIGRWVTGFGIVYLSAMIIRYVVWMTLHPEARWLGGTIPIVFHCVLAMFLILVGRYHRAPSRVKGAAS